ncbi:meiotic recombination protein DMC1/LIM15-like [Tropilaelaps mercedesae]|uniref:Meiotic recombination protein DMC1/LIM15-like n=1 Tax=Tropilaelaps mercedesae TaxID=418985 RepID=A0A1V9XTM6_9ACAR|nr:meiotic recombination protein DMC1/LIM15-like [Tropilaelaps mercedesae]
MAVWRERLVEHPETSFVPSMLPWCSSKADVYGTGNNSILLQNSSQENVATLESQVSRQNGAAQSQTSQRRKTVPGRSSGKGIGRGAPNRNVHSSSPDQQQVVPLSSQQDRDATEDENDFIIQDIGLLQEHGINVSDINKLQGAGICTLRGVQMATRKKLINIKGLSEAKVDKIKEAVTKSFNAQGWNGFMTARSYGEHRRCVFHVPTGSSRLDCILGGGLESMAITEVFGEFRCGKTQISHTCCVTCQIPIEDRHYPGGKALFIDTENTFRPDRLRQIANRFGLDEDQTLDNVLYARAFTSDQQMELLDLAAAKFHEEPGIFKLLIVDSVMALFR